MEGHLDRVHKKKRVVSSMVKDVMRPAVIRMRGVCVNYRATLTHFCCNYVYPAQHCWNYA